MALGDGRAGLGLGFWGRYRGSTTRATTGTRYGGHQAARGAALPPTRAPTRVSREDVNPRGAFEFRTLGSSPVRNPKNATRMRAVSPETVDHEAIDTMVAIDDKRGSSEAPVPVKWQ